MSIVRAARGALPVALLLALALPAAAQADATASSSGGAVTFTVNDSLDHVTSVDVALNGHLTITDADGITPAGGCTAAGANTADCGLASAVTHMTATLGPGNDRFYGPDVLALPMTIAGGGGNDDLFGGGGPDDIDGGPGDDEIGGGEGADTLDGGDGNDAVGAWDQAADAAVACGAGSDTVDFDYGIDPVDLDCELHPPHLEEAPAILGAATVGSTLSHTTPRATGGAATAAYTYWERCDTSGQWCADIDGAEDASYTLTAADVGARIRAMYWLNNAAGWDGALSDPTPIVTYEQLAPPPAKPPAPRAARRARP